MHPEPAAIKESAAKAAFPVSADIPVTAARPGTLATAEHQATAATAEYQVILVLVDTPELVATQAPVGSPGIAEHLAIAVILETPEPAGTPDILVTAVSVEAPPTPVWEIRRSKICLSGRSATWERARWICARSYLNHIAMGGCWFKSNRPDQTNPFVLFCVGQ